LKDTQKQKKKEGRLFVLAITIGYSFSSPFCNAQLFKSQRKEKKKRQQNGSTQMMIWRKQQQKQVCVCVWEGEQQTQQQQQQQNEQKESSKGKANRWRQPRESRLFRLSWFGRQQLGTNKAQTAWLHETCHRIRFVFFPSLFLPWRLLCFSLARLTLFGGVTPPKGEIRGDGRATFLQTKKKKKEAKDYTTARFFFFLCVYTESF
jgi:hypothetical protein